MEKAKSCKEVRQKEDMGRKFAKQEGMETRKRRKRHDMIIVRGGAEAVENIKGWERWMTGVCERDKGWLKKKELGI